MKSKKNIDQLFKERFENFEATPPPHVWENIQSQLRGQKKERRVIPLWWKVGAVAALLALLLTVGNALFNPFSDTQSTELVDENIEDLKQKVDLENNEIIPNEAESTVIASETTSLEKASEEDTKSEKEASTVSSEKSIIKNSNTVIASEEKRVIQTNTDKRFKEPQNVISSQKEAIGVTSEIIENSKESGIDGKTTTVDSRINTETSPNKEVTSVTTNEKTEAKKISETQKIVETVEPNTSKETTVVAQVETNTQDPKKKSIFEEIEATEAAVAKAEKRNLRDRRWEVAPSVAPVYYSSLGEGSSIDPSFADNSQSGDINFSYGVKVSYHINDRLSIRSGVSNVDLSYATGGIELATGPVSQALRSINYNGNTNVTTAVDKGSISEINTNPNNPFENLTPKSASGNVALIQNLSYYEVPMELSYALLNKRVGVHVLGGFSTLFLGNNEVSVVADNLNETLGEANNLSSLSFSTNIGLGFDYKLSKKFKFNIEPMFKYQLNPYTDSSVDFKPYYVGVYTGFSLTF